MNEILQQELVRMFNEDQENIGTQGWINPELHEQHCRRIKAIVTEFGWPTAASVGEDGTMAAWILVQHHDELVFQQHCLPLLEKAVNEGQARKADYAYLLDRILVTEGKKQVYGTQFGTRTDGTYGVMQVKEPHHLDQRRKEAGLQPFEEYDAYMQASQAKK